LVDFLDFVALHTSSFGAAIDRSFPLHIGIEDTYWGTGSEIGWERDSSTVMQSVSRELMTTGPIWAKELGPVVERVAMTFFDANSGQSDSQRKSRRDTIPTRLTGANRSRGREAQRSKTLNAVSTHF